MNKTITITFNEDFASLCDIFQVNPEKLIQHFADKVSFPFFFSHLNSIGRWPTFMFLEYLDHAEIYNAEEMDFNEPYLEKIYRTIEQHLEDDSDEAKAENAAREVVREWHKALLKHRAKYLLDNLPSGD